MCRYKRTLNEEKAYYKLVFVNKLVLLLWFVVVFLILLKKQLFPLRVAIIGVVSLLLIIDGIYFIFFGHSPLVKKIDCSEKTKNLITTVWGTIMFGLGLAFLIILFCRL